MGVIRWYIIMKRQNRSSLGKIGNKRTDKIKSPVQKKKRLIYHHNLLSGSPKRILTYTRKKNMNSSNLFQNSVGGHKVNIKDSDLSKSLTSLICTFVATYKDTSLTDVIHQYSTVTTCST